MCLLAIYVVFGDRVFFGERVLCQGHTSCVALTTDCVGSGGREPRLRCRLTLVLMRDVESLSHLSHLTSRALLAMVGVSGLGELRLPLHPEFSSVSVCLYMCPLYGDSCPVRGGSILMSSLDLHQLCEDLSFVCKVMPRYLGLRLQHLTLRGCDVTPHTLQRL